jgi:hypothetical protein
MANKKPSLKKVEDPPAEHHVLDDTNPVLKRIGGSNYDDWNNILANQAMASGWYGNNPVREQAQKQHTAYLGFLSGIGPNDELEGMLAAQLLASHNAAMECYRRAMISDQPFEGRKENLNQANKLSRTHATLLEALNRHRGKGQQKVTVEHVHVHDGGQAIVGNVEGVGGGIRTKLEDQPHVLGYAPGQTLRSANPEWEGVPVASNEERSVSAAWRTIAGSAER